MYQYEFTIEVNSCELCEHITIYIYCSNNNYNHQIWAKLSGHSNTPICPSHKKQNDWEKLCQRGMQRIILRIIIITIWVLLLSWILLLSILLSLLLSSLLKDWVEFPSKLAIFICLTYNLIKMHYFAFFFVTFHLMLVFWICRVGHKFERISNKHF